MSGPTADPRRADLDRRVLDWLRESDFRSDDTRFDALARDLRDKTPATITSGSLDDESLKKGVSETGIIIHCTPIGMHPKTDASLVPAGLLRPDHVVFDIVYNPRETRLLREARAAGCRIVQGLEMFVNQAVVQFELWTGETAPRTS